MKYRKYSKYSIENPEVWAINQDKDAKKETKILAKLLKKYGKVKTILDIGCGVGSHIYELTKKGYICKGVDADPAKIKFAQKRYPKLTFGTADMRTLKEKKKYDTIICIGSIIVFNKTNEQVVKTLKNFYNHLRNKGVLIIGTSNPIHLIENKDFKKSFVDKGIDRKKFGVKASYEQKINASRQTHISKRTFYRLSDNKKVGVYQKETRLFFPQELKFFLEQAGFQFLDFYAGISLNKNLNNSWRMLVVANKRD